MPISVFDSNVLEISASTGVGSFALDPVPGFARFSNALAIGKTCHYMIKAVDTVGRPTGAYEFGIGTYSAANTLTRTAVVGSSNGNAAVPFSIGDKLVSLTALAPTNEALRNDWQSALQLDVAGAVQFFAMSAVPTGWLKANGAAIPRGTYGRLFERIGTYYGGGDGSTTFNVPDLRGEFLRGWDDARGVDNGRSFGTFQGSNNLSHVHGVSDAGHVHNLYDPGHAHSAWTDVQGYHDHAMRMYGEGFSFNAGGNQFRSPYTKDGNGDVSMTSGAGGHGHNIGMNASATGMSVYAAAAGVAVQASGGAEARPRNVALLACIKF